MKSWQVSGRLMGGLMAIFAGLGLLASLTLMSETMSVIANPDYEPSCNINPTISCGAVMASEYATILNVPNPIFGIMGFTALLTLAAIVMSGVSMRFRMWMVVWLGALFGLGFAMYLFAVSMLYIGSICPWCALLWVSTVAIFWTVTTHMAAIRAFDYNSTLARLSEFWTKYAPAILVSMYVILLAIVFVRFQDFWLSLL